MKKVKKKIDPITCNVPNVCFSLMEPKDKRWHKMKEQRLEYGFDDSETWSLDATLVHFMYPRLKRYLEIANDVIVIDDEMRKAIEDMIWFFERFLKGEEDCDFELTQEEYTRLPEIFEKFGKQFMRLWW